MNINVHIYIDIFTYILIHMNVNVHIHIDIFTYILMRIDPSPYAALCKYIYTYIYVYIHINMLFV
jgi:hypothetical protein